MGSECRENGQIVQMKNILDQFRLHSNFTSIAAVSQFSKLAEN